jgi:SAM-dependent methyltransferase
MPDRFSLETYFAGISQGADAINVFGLEYLAKHRKRFQVTVEMLAGIGGRAALEVGATDFFQIYLARTLGFEEVWGTIFAGAFTDKISRRAFRAAGVAAETTIVDIQLENELFPLSGETFDLVLLCEVIEHFDVDPMFPLIELNRIMNVGGKLLVTTPNSCSARNVYKICAGYRPHFYMQYQRDRSPYRHNFEHDIHSLRILLEAAGFGIVTIRTEDVFEEPDPRGRALLQKNGFPVEHRGDDIFMLAEKRTAPTQRWPTGIYA